MNNNLEPAAPPAGAAQPARPRAALLNFGILPTTTALLTATGPKLPLFQGD